MSYSESEAARIIAEARENVSRLLPARAGREEQSAVMDRDAPPVSDDADRFVSPTKTLNQRHRDELAEQERRFEVERERARIRQRRERAWAAHPFEQRVGAVENSMLELARGTGRLAEAVSAELTALRIENLELRTLIHKLEKQFAELPNTPIDLPKLPLRGAMQ
jgi:hypothetical protein